VHSGRTFLAVIENRAAELHSAVRWLGPKRRERIARHAWQEAKQAGRYAVPPQPTESHQPGGANLKTPTASEASSKCGAIPTCSRKDIYGIGSRPPTRIAPEGRILGNSSNRAKAGIATFY